MKKSCGIVLLAVMFCVISVGCYGVDKGSVTLIRPAGGAKTFLPFPQFNWREDTAAFKDVGSPVKYEIQISRDAGFGQIVDSDTVYLNRYVDDKPLGVGDYFWRVRAIEYGKRAAGWSVVGSFSVTDYDEQVRVSCRPEVKECSAFINRAMNKAKKLAAAGRSVRVVFEKGDYVFDGSAGAALLNFSGDKNILVNGGGSRIILRRRDTGLVTANNCRNLVIMGFVLDFEGEKTFLQGRVKSINFEKNQIEVMLDKGFPGYDVDYVKEGADWLFQLDPDIDGRIKSGAYNFNRTSEITKGVDGSWLLTLSTRNLSRDQWAVGDRFIHVLRKSPKPGLVDLADCENTTVYDISSNGASGMHYRAIEGTDLNVLHCSTTMAKGHWFSGNADGIHVRGYKRGPWIEGCHINAIADDSVALYARPATIAKVHPGGKKNAVICNKVFFNLEAGDEVSFFDPVKGVILLETKVVSVDKSIEIKAGVGEGTVDKPVAGIADQSGSDIVVVFADEVPGDLNIVGKVQDVVQIWDRSKSCGDFMIRNNTFENVRRFGTVFRARRGVVESNNYIRTSSSAITFENEPTWPNGLYASDIIIRENTIDDCGFEAGAPSVIAMKFQSRRGLAKGIGPRRILIEDNRISKCSSPEIGLYFTGDVVVRGNKVLATDGSSRDVEVKTVNVENFRQGR